jgi:hypothetical protein
MYVCEEQHILKAYENRMLRRKLGLKREHIRRDQSKLHE